MAAAIPTNALVDEKAKERLYSELPSKVKEALGLGAPLLHHLNGDTSWLLQILLADQGERRWYNILIEPWFTDIYTVVSRLLFHASHSILPAVGTINEVGDLCLEVDRLSGTLLPEQGEEEYARQRRIDAVMLCENEQDHIHEPTLRQLDPRIPIFGPPAAVARVKAYNHFENTFVAPLWSQAAPVPIDSPLGAGIQAHHIGDESGKAPHFEATIFLSFPDISSDADKRQGIFYNPHGPSPSNVLPSADDSLDVLAYMANNFSHTAGGVVTNHDNVEVAEAVIKTGAQYVVETHMEAQNISGLMNWSNKKVREIPFEEAKQTLLLRLSNASDISGGTEGKAEQIERLERAVSVRISVGESFVVV